VTAGYALSMHDVLTVTFCGMIAAAQATTSARTMTTALQSVSAATKAMESAVKSLTDAE